MKILTRGQKRTPKQTITKTTYTSKELSMAQCDIARIQDLATTKKERIFF